MGEKKSRRAVFLDRDGTIIVERHYLSDPSQVELLPGAAQGLFQLKEIGLALVVVTNQSAIGRGLFDHLRLDLIHQRMGDLLKAEGVSLDGVYSCPHLPEEGCACRKPRTGLVERAARELALRPRDSFVVGDKASDIALGRNMGGISFLVRTLPRKGGAQVSAEVLPQKEVVPDYVVDDLRQVAQVVSELLLGRVRP